MLTLGCYPTNDLHILLAMNKRKINVTTDNRKQFLFEKKFVEDRSIYIF